jgi:hypothetical protein
MTPTTEIGFDRDRFAKWYAKRHFDTDIGVEQIYYLPTNAPAREIRFLEVNRLIAETMSPEPIDFGVDIGGAEPHTLYVFDVTPAQWEAIQKGEMKLPAGWTLHASQPLGRR